MPPKNRIKRQANIVHFIVVFSRALVVSPVREAALDLLVLL